MVLFTCPTKLGKLQPLEFTHPQVIGCLVVYVTVWGDNPENFDEPLSTGQKL
jgi:hypothetical protein